MIKNWRINASVIDDVVRSIKKTFRELAIIIPGEETKIVFTWHPRLFKLLTHFMRVNKFDIDSYPIRYLGVQHRKGAKGDYYFKVWIKDDQSNKHDSG